jgi:hypothetical protein
MGASHAKSQRSGGCHHRRRTSAEDELFAQPLLLTRADTTSGHDRRARPAARSLLAALLRRQVAQPPSPSPLPTPPPYDKSLERALRWPHNTAEVVFVAGAEPPLDALLVMSDLLVAMYLRLNTLGIRTEAEMYSASRYSLTARVLTDPTFRELVCLVARADGGIARAVGARAAADTLELKRGGGGGAVSVCTI